jgi:hypothetical protein
MNRILPDWVSAYLYFVFSILTALLAQANGVPQLDGWLAPIQAVAAQRLVQSQPDRQTHTGC